jgi:hypothetical protein
MMIAEYDNFTWKTSLVRSVQADIVNALRRGDRQRASMILSNFQNTDWALTKDDFSYILEYCAEAPDPLVKLLLDVFLNFFYKSLRFNTFVLTSTPSVFSNISSLLWKLWNSWRRRLLA